MKRNFCFSLLVCFSIVGISQTTVTTVNIGSSGADAQVLNTSAGTNYGTSTTMQVFWDFVSGGTSKIYRSYIYADLSTIPATAVVTDAFLKLKASAVTSPNGFALYRIGSSGTWVENTINYTNQPTSIITSDALTYTSTSMPSITSVGWHNFDIKTHAQLMVTNPSLNKGWRMTVQSESGSTDRGATYVTGEGAIADQARVEVTWVYPIEIAGTVTHCGEGLDNGSIVPSVTLGSGTYSSYQWYRVVTGGTLTSIESGTNIADAAVSDLSDGLYLLTVVDNKNTRGYQYFLVGEENNTTTVEFSISNNTDAATYNDDALLQLTLSGSDGSQNGGAAIYTQTQVDGSVNIYSLLRYKVVFDSRLTYDFAELQLKCPSLPSGHYRDVSNTNAGAVYRITQNWNESTVNWSNKPARDASSPTPLSISQTNPNGYVSRNDNINVLSFIEYWKNNPTANHGMMFEINTAQSGFARLLYYSSDFSTYASRPKLVLTYSMQNMFYELSDQQEGSYYIVPGDDILRIKYHEEYLDENMGLAYKIKSSSGTTVITDVTQPKSIEYGDNREKINVSALAAGYYTLEVSNDKNEKWYLRFQVQ